MSAVVPAIAPAVTFALKLIADFEPEIALALEALTTHNVDRATFNAAVRDLIVKQGEARMRAAFPGQDP